MNGSLGNQPFDTVTVLNANLNASFLSRSDSITPTTLSNSFYANNFKLANTIKLLAIADKEFFQFTLNSKPGYTLSLDTLEYKLRRSSSGPNRYMWMYSTDATNFFDIPGIDSNYAGTDLGGKLFKIPLDIVPALRNVPNTTTLTFRLYAWRTAGGAFGLGRSSVAGEYSLSLDGTLASQGPQIFVSPTTLSGFSYQFGTGPSASQSFNLSGTSLSPASGSLSVSASTDYEISTDNTNFVSGTLTIPYSGAALSATPVYVRLKSGLSIGLYNGQSISASGGGATAKSVSCDGSVSVFVSANSDVVAVAASEAAAVSSLINNAPPLTSATGAQVWSFTIRDGGATAPDADALPTIVKSIVLVQSAGNGVNDWSDAIRTVSLFDGSTLVATGTVTANQIQFTGLTYSVPDNASRTLTLRLSLNCPFGSTNKDNEDFGFSLSNTNFTTDNNTVSSQKSAFPAIQSANGSNVLTVAGTQLRFLQQPSASVAINSNFSPAVLLSCTDACGNLDLNFTGTVNITSTGSLLTSPSTATASAGIAAFPGLSFTAAGGPFTLTAASAGITSATSSPFSVVTSTVLGSGDMMIVGFDTYVVAGSDIISIANFVPLLSGTSFTLANVVYDWKAAANVREDRWYNGNSGQPFTNGPAFAKFVYNGVGSIPSGSVICVTITGSGTISGLTINGVDRFAEFVITNSTGGNAKTVSSNVAINSTQPDAIFLMQGDFVPAITDLTDAGGDLYRTFNGIVFGGIQTFGSFQPFSVAGNAGGARVSRVHPSIQCIAISTLAAAGGAFYAYYNGTRTGTHRNLIRAVADYAGANWVRVSSGSVDGNDLAAPGVCTNTYTVTSNVSPGLWGGESGSDWFNCNNWDDFTVPTSSTDVLISSGAVSDVQINNNSASAAQFNFSANAKSINITGRKLIIENTVSSVPNTLNVIGNLTINAASGLDMNDGNAATADGVINIGGNWTSNIISGFDEGNSLINFNGTTTQVVDVPDGDVFAKLTNSNSSAGSVVLASKGTSVVISDSLNLNAGTLGLGDNTLVLNNKLTGAATLSGSASASITIGGTAGGALGTLNFTAGARQLNNLTMNRTGAGGSAILGTDLQVNTLVNISSGTLDAASTTLNGAAGLTMTGGELQLAKTGTVPELAGGYNLSGGAVHLKGAGSQTFRPENYFNIISSSTGSRTFQSGATTGIAAVFTRGTNAYTFTGSTVNYNGSGNQTIAPFTAGLTPGSTYNNLSLSSSGIKSLSGNTDVEGSLSLNNNITLALGNQFLNLRSTASQTARVAPVSATAGITYGTGRFVVERYFPGKRSWRLVTAPVTVDAGRSVFGSWQVGGSNTLSGSGTYVTGPNPSAANGLDISTFNNSSLKTFNAVTSQFDPVLNTKTTLLSGTTGAAGTPDNRGYFLFVRGDRTAANPNAFNASGSINATTLRDTGKIQTGQYVFPCNTNTVSNYFTLIGNPYASPVDFDNITKSGVANKFWAWDPNLNTVGGYVIVDRALNTIVPTVGTTQNEIIQSKQAIMVQTTNSVNPQVVFQEGSKSSVNNLTLFRPQKNPEIGSLSLNLFFTHNDGSMRVADGLLNQFSDRFSNTTDVLDGLRFSNVNETFGVLNGSNNLMLNRRKFPVAGDTLFMRTVRFNKPAYTLKIDASKLAVENLAGYWEDNYLKSSTPFSMEGETSIDITTNSDAASRAADRFRIVFRKLVDFTGIKAQLADKDVLVQWTVNSDSDVANYEVERSVDGGNSFSRIGSVASIHAARNQSATYAYTDLAPTPGIYHYRIKALGSRGVVAYTEMVRVVVMSSAGNLYVFPNPVKAGQMNLQLNTVPAGNYFLRLIGSNGQLLFSNSFVHDGTRGMRKFNLPSSVIPGNYTLELGCDARKMKYVLPVIVVVE